MLIPNASEMSKNDRRTIERLWKRVSGKSLPSLLEQLEHNYEIRLLLDSTLLELLGISRDKATPLAMLLEKGALEAIRMLKATMKPRKPD